MIRKTKHNRSIIIFDKNGKITLRSGMSEEDAWNKLAYYEKLEKEGRIMELADAHWKKIYGPSDKYMCSHCGSVTSVPEINNEPSYPYCPYCNAKMHGRDWKE